MSERYKSPLGILILLVEIVSGMAMIYSLGVTFEGPWELLALVAGVIIFTVVGGFFYWISDTWVGLTFGLLFASLVTSPLFYYVWSKAGWPAGGFLCIYLVWASANIWRKDAETS